jgi:hypothetical protein
MHSSSPERENRPSDPNMLATPAPGLVLGPSGLLDVAHASDAEWERAVWQPIADAAALGVSTVLTVDGRTQETR